MKSDHFWVVYFAELAAMVSPNTTIWFVDERFKRKAIAPTQQQVAMELKRRVFYASDRRYVEVMGHAFPLDHDQWELLPQQILGMADPPICEPLGQGRHHLWTWVEDFVGGDGLHWSGEWFIQTIQYYIKSKAKAQAEAQAKARAEALAKAQAKAQRRDADKNRKPTDDDHNDGKTGDGKSDDSEPQDPKRILYFETQVTRFGLLACEFF